MMRRERKQYARDTLHPEDKSCKGATKDDFLLFAALRFSGARLLYFMQRDGWSADVRIVREMHALKYPG